MSFPMVAVGPDTPTGIRVGHQLVEGLHRFPFRASEDM
jgi:hypothetical protein